MGIDRDTGGYKGLHRVTIGYRGLHKGLQGVTEGYKVLQGFFLQDTISWLQGVKRGYKGCFHSPEMLVCYIKGVFSQLIFRIHRNTRA